MVQALLLLAILLTGIEIAHSDAPPGHYVVESETVTDTKTGLVWQRSFFPTAATAAEADGYCKRLQVAEGGWRLPTLKELLTLVDPSRFRPAIDTLAFPDTPPSSFITSTSATRRGQSIPLPYQYVVHFEAGSTADGGGLTGRIRCVR